MENTPEPDFEMQFYTGNKIIHSSIKNTLIVKIALSNERNAPFKSYTLDPGAIPQSEPFQSLYMHFQECYKQTKDIEKSAQLDSTTKYPLILKTGMMNTMSHRSTTPSPPRSINPSTLSTLSQNPQATTLVQSRSTRHLVPPTTTVPLDLDSSNQLNKRFIHTIGWCFKSGDTSLPGSFCMCFLDGISMTVFVKEHVLVYDDGKVEVRMKIDRVLPNSVKSRLAHLQSLLSYFRLSHTIYIH